MPPKVKITKASVIEASISLLREGGINALTARAVSMRLGCSTQPIFSIFGSMQGLIDEVFQEVYRIYLSFISREIDAARYPEYKAAGMGYIRFAKEEKALFRCLFMSEKRDDRIVDSSAHWKEMTEHASKSVGTVGGELFHLELWMVVHGIATMAATDYMHFDEELISRIVSDAYFGIKARLNAGKGDE